MSQRHGNLCYVQIVRTVAFTFIALNINAIFFILLNISFSNCNTKLKCYNETIKVLK